VGSRERKRAERRKRKRRTGVREVAPPAAEPADDGGGARGLSRSEQKDREARESLEPLREGERPGAVTAGAIVSGVLALVIWASAALAAITDIDVRGSDPQAVPLALFAAVLTLMAYGMWRARYWAVLGFQALLVLVMLSSALGLIQVTTVLEAIGTLVLLSGSGVLFYLMVKALARIQMPQRAPRE
jgi:hypothetical protein